MATPDSCPTGGGYAIPGGNELIKSVGTTYLNSKTNSNLQGTFRFKGSMFRNSDTTFITNGEFNVDYKN